MESNHRYLDTILVELPGELQQQVLDICTQSSSARPCLDLLIRFMSDGEPVGLQDATCAEWAERQNEARAKLASLSSLQANGSALKRPRDDANDTDNTVAKRQKSDVANSDDPPRFTLHAISVSSPIRKKVDIFIRKHTVQFINPSSGACESTISISSLRRSFLVPTRGKQKPHWTVIILATDTNDRGAKASKNAATQITFGLDAVTTSPLKVTDHESPKGESTLPKGTEVLPMLLSFLSRLENVPVLRPSLDVFKSACVSNSPGIEGFLGAKGGSLWFFPEGILWEGKPCEFWALEDLKGKNDGVRIVSATGRMCTLFLTRKSPPAEGEDEGEDFGEDTQFSMIDGKEQEVINTWVRNHRHAFGKSGGEQNQEQEEVQARDEKTKAVNAGPQTILQLEDRSDDEDKDFEASSVSEEGASSSESSDEEGDAGDGAADEGEAMDTDEEAREEGDLDPARHPLLRPGAMPKMSRAAMDMVVGMVEEDMLGNSEEKKDELDED